MPVGENCEGLSRGVADDLARHNERKYLYIRCKHTYTCLYTHTAQKFTCTHAYIYIHTHVYMYSHIHMYIAYSYIHMYIICIHIFIGIWQHKPVNRHMHIYMYTYICIGGDGNSHACCAADKAAQQNVNRLQEALMGALPGKLTSRAYVCVCLHL